MSRTTFSLVPMMLIVGISAATAADPTITIVTLGDSYINGYTISDPADRFSGKVAAELRAGGHDVVFQDIGFTNSSLDALHWLQSSAGKALLANPAQHVLILETAQNDCSLFKIDRSRDNVDHILAALASSHIPVLVVGTVPYDFCISSWGLEYGVAFPAIFSDLAAKYGDLLYPDFKAGIEGNTDLLGYDRDHPNKAGEAIIATNILPAVEALVARASAQ